MSLTVEQEKEFEALIANFRPESFGTDTDIARFFYEYQQKKIDALIAENSTAPKNAELTKAAKEIISFLNEKTGRNYRPVPANLEPICARMKEGATLQELRQVVAKKTREWSSHESMAMYLRPATLFNRTKFAQYQGELV